MTTSPTALQKRPDETGHEYVRRNKDALAQILHHGSTLDVRAYAFALLNHYGTERDIEEVKRELDALQRGDLP
jgi:hypothetical protein